MHQMRVHMAKSCPGSPKAMALLVHHPGCGHRPTQIMSALQSLLVRHIMTDSIVTLREHHSLPLASALMFERGVAHLPILNQEGQLVGLVSQRDLLAAELNHSRSLAIPSDEREELDLLLPLGQMMEREVAVLSPDMTVRAAAQHLLDHRQGFAPVLDEMRAVIGIVAEDDILDLCLQRLKGSRTSVADIMTREVTTARSSETVADALALMNLENIHHLPITDFRGHLQGLVSHRDLQIFQRSNMGQGEHHPARTLKEFLDRDVWTTTQLADARDAAQTLRDNRFGCLPVVEEGHLLGIVTQSDFLRMILDMDTDESRKVPRDVPSNYYVSAPLRCVSPDASIAEALECFARFAVSTLLVVEGELTLGILSQSDALRALQASTNHHRDHQEGFLERKVADFMSRELVTVAADKSIGETAALLMAHHIHHVVVVEDDRPLGILGTTDILVAVRDHRIATPLSDFMSRMIFTIDVHETYQAGLRYLQRAAVTGLVVQDGKLPVGVFGQGEAVLAATAPPEARIEEIMSSRFLCLADDTPAFRAAQQAAALGAVRIVVQSAGETVGIVTATDFARLLAQAVPPSENVKKDADTNEHSITFSDEETRR